METPQKRVLIIDEWIEYQAVKDYYKKGGDQHPLHHLFGLDALEKAGYELVLPSFEKTSGRIDAFGNKFGVNNLRMQIHYFLNQKGFDYVFAPFLDSAFLLTILRTIGLFRKPIVGIRHSAFLPGHRNPIKRTKRFLVRFFNTKGVDHMMFFNEKMRDKSLEVGMKHKYEAIRHWGGEYEFFEKYISKQSTPQKKDYIFAIGSSWRDYETLIEAFNHTDFTLKIFPKSKGFREQIKANIPENVVLDYSVPAGMESTGHLRKVYYNALAVALPLKELEDSYVPFGCTVLMEAMAMGKPIISTYNPAFAIDLEKEKVGISVPFGDVEAWTRAVEYLRDNPEEAEAMGRRARELSRKYYNYQNFSDQLVDFFNRELQIEPLPSESKLNKLPKEII